MKKTALFTLFTLLDFPRAATGLLVLAFLSWCPASAVAACVESPPGLVSWWKFNENASDNLGNNPGITSGDPAFVSGKVGQAIALDGVDDDVAVPASPALNVGTGDGMTIEGWFKPQDPFAQRPLVEWNDRAGNSGVHLWVSQSFNGDLFANVIDAGNVSHYVQSAAGLVTTNDWYHIALTYDRASGVAVIYLNGALAGQQTIGSFALHTSYDLFFGSRIYVGGSVRFQGAMDEWALYTRALSLSEVQTIVTAGSNGRCQAPTPPSISRQPTNQTVTVGQPATFSVEAHGSAPLTYHWYKAAQPLGSATNSLLAIPQVTLDNGGPYQVVVANAGGAVTSQVAILTVTPAPACAPSPPGLVSWWTFDGDASDATGTNPGVADGGPTFAGGEVAEAIVLDGLNDDVAVPSSPSLNVGIGAGMTIEGWFNPDQPFAQRPLIEWNDRHANVGVHLWVSQSGNGDLFANLMSADNVAHHLFSAGGLVTTSGWYHVALTYNRASGVAVIYLNGNAVAQQAIGSFALHTTYDLFFGRRIYNGGSIWFKGAMDEWGLYARALSSAEVQTVFAAGSFGRCKIPITPSITTQPTNQTVQTGQTAEFRVQAIGTKPLVFQWFKDGQSLVGATNAVLTLPGVVVSSAGNYAAVVSNIAGAATSTVAVLTVPLPPGCVPAPSDLVAWWPFDQGGETLIGSATVNLSGNPAISPGEVGSALFLDGGDDDAYVPANAQIDVGAASGLTFEGWIRPANVSSAQPIAEWNKRSGLEGVHFWLAQPPPYGTGNGCLFAHLIDTEAGSHRIASPPELLHAGQWQHVALTYDKTSGSAALYVDGALVAQANLGTFRPQTAPPYDLLLGRRPNGGTFTGGMDEVSLYRRALTAQELRSIFEAGVSGKCKTGFPPRIVEGPQSQVVVQGTDVSFHVTALGTVPLSYRWFFNDAPIGDANTPELALTSVQSNQSGGYSVVISNVAGVVTSSIAILSVRPSPTRIRAVSVSGLSGGTLSVPLEIVAQGSEHEIQFSLVFPPASLSFRSVTLPSELPGSTTLTLNTNSAASGRVGVHIVLPAGVTFSPTNHSLASVGFIIAQVSEVFSAALSFEDQPVTKRVLDSAGQELLATFESATASVTPTLLEIVSVEGPSGGEVDVPIRIHALGIENAVSFSLQFPPSQASFVGVTLPAEPNSGTSLILNSNEAPVGRIGLGVALAPGRVFDRGTQQLVRVRFRLQTSLESVTVPILFSDVPTAREASTSTSGPLPLVSSDGLILITKARFEADVAPVPDGDQVVNILDWVQVGRFAAGLDPVPAAAFQRADCAPRETKGNGVISVADWVQAGRYFAALDPLTSAGGPNEPSTSGSPGGSFSPSSVRTVSLPPTHATPNGSFIIPVRLAALGGENAFGFSVRFDSSKLAFVGATEGRGLEGLRSPTLNPNTTTASTGQVGITLSLQPGDALRAGTADLVVLTFQALSGSGGVTDVSLVDAPVAREVVDVDARTLSASFIGGTITFDSTSGAPRLDVTRSAGTVFLSWPNTATNFQLEGASLLSAPNWDRVGMVPFEIGGQKIVNLGPTNEQRFFRLRTQ